MFDRMCLTKPGRSVAHATCLLLICAGGFTKVLPYHVEQSLIGDWAARSAKHSLVEILVRLELLTGLPLVPITLFNEILTLEGIFVSRSGVHLMDFKMLIIQLRHMAMDYVHLVEINI